MSDGKIRVIGFDDKHIDALAFGTDTYEVHLEFRGGGISRKCTCPVSDFCKHMVAVAIIWDKNRDIKLPDKNQVERQTIPPPLITFSDLKKAYKNPLKANLDVIRIAADELLSSSRNHAKLPKVPRNITDEKEFSKILVKKSISEIRSWSRRSNFDYYFCAGEVTAAFCEMCRIIRERWGNVDTMVKNEIIELLDIFRDEIVYEIIDDSDGLHEFLDAHIEALKLE